MTYLFYLFLFYRICYTKHPWILTNNVVFQCKNEANVALEADLDWFCSQHNQSKRKNCIQLNKYTYSYRLRFIHTLYIYILLVRWIIFVLHQLNWSIWKGKSDMWGYQQIQFRISNLYRLVSCNANFFSLFFAQCDDHHVFQANRLISFQYSPSFHQQAYSA